MSEIRQIPSYGGKYLVSEDGRVFSTVNTRGNPLPVPKQLAVRTTKTGYIDVQIRMYGKNLHPLVHVLVAEAFIGPKNGLDVNHKDGDKSNNHISNLEYLSRSDNVRHSLVNGLKTPARGSDTARAVLTEDAIPLIRKAVASIKRVNGRAPSGSIARIAKTHGVSPNAIHGVISGRSWKHVP